uniref:Putative secreted protein n=1 Tax=Psorophora albipes TaxID=869069 RepID=T1E2V7_9DIPT
MLCYAIFSLFKIVFLFQRGRGEILALIFGKFQFMFLISRSFWKTISKDVTFLTIKFCKAEPFCRKNKLSDQLDFAS